MAKRIIVYKQNFVDGRDLGEEKYILSLGKTLKLLEIRTLHTKKVKDLDVQSFEFFKSDGAEKNVIGRAVAGAIVAGGIGAMVGGLSGTTKEKAWCCEIVEPNGTTLYRLKNEHDKKILEKYFRRRNL